MRFSGFLASPSSGKTTIKSYEYIVPSSVSQSSRNLREYSTFLPIERSIELIREAGGVPVLAHPFQYKRDDAGLRELIELCMRSGLRGMECRYSGYDAAMSAYLEALAAEYGLIRTGGSDFHGSIKPEIRLGDGKGGLEVPLAFLDELKRAAGKDGRQSRKNPFYL